MPEPSMLEPWLPFLRQPPRNGCDSLERVEL